MVVQRHQPAVALDLEAGVELLDRRSVRNQRDDAALGNPVEQRLVIAFEAGADLVGHHLLVGRLVRLHQIVAIAGVEQQEVALLHLDILRLHHILQHLVGDEGAATAERLDEIDQHAASLRAGHRHLLDAELQAFRAARLIGAERVDARPPAIIIGRLEHPAAVDVIHPAPMGKAVPLGRILQAHRHAVIAADVDRRDIMVEHRGAAELGREQLGAEAHRVLGLAARIIERQAEREGLAFLDFAHRRETHLVGDGVHHAEFVIGAEVTPVRTLGADRPAIGFRDSLRQW